MHFFTICNKTCSIKLQLDTLYIKLQIVKNVSCR